MNTYLENQDHSCSCYLEASPVQVTECRERLPTTVNTHQSILFLGAIKHIQTRRRSHAFTAESPRQVGFVLLFVFVFIGFFNEKAKEIPSI